MFTGCNEIDLGAMVCEKFVLKQLFNDSSTKTFIGVFAAAALLEHVNLSCYHLCLLAESV